MSINIINKTCTYLSFILLSVENVCVSLNIKHRNRFFNKKSSHIGRKKIEFEQKSLNFKYISLRKIINIIRRGFKKIKCKN